jgi:hypothetical protein
MRCNYVSDCFSPLPAYWMVIAGLGGWLVLGGVCRDVIANDLTLTKDHHTHVNVPTTIHLTPAQTKTKSTIHRTMKNFIKNDIDGRTYTPIPSLPHSLNNDTNAHASSPPEVEASTRRGVVDKRSRGSCIRICAYCSRVVSRRFSSLCRRQCATSGGTAFDVCTSAWQHLY